MAAPNFIVVGATKAGTTSLYEYLAEHLQVFMSPMKEPTFFGSTSEPFKSRAKYTQEVRRFRGVDVKVRVFSGRAAPVHWPAIRIRDDAASVELLSGVANELAIGEASTAYLESPGVEERMHDALGPVKIIVLARHPVDRAYSHYLQNRDRGLEPASTFREALSLERTRILEWWHREFYYFDQGMYARHMARYLTAIGEDRVRIYFTEDLKRSPLQQFIEVCSFLGVDEELGPTRFRNYNARKQTRSRRAAGWIEGPSMLKAARKRFLPPTVQERIYVSMVGVNPRRPRRLVPRARRELSERFRTEIHNLEGSQAETCDIGWAERDEWMPRGRTRAPARWLT